MRLKRMACAAAVTAVVAVVPAGIALAAPPTVVSITPTVISPTDLPPFGGGSLYGATPLQVSLSNVTPFELIFINICLKSTADPTFSYASDCVISSGEQYTVDPGATTISFEYTGTFYGTNPDPTGTVNCADASYTPPAGETRQDTCWVRITKNTPGNNDDDVQQAVTYQGGPGPVIPEAPYAALLPLGALAVLGGGYLVLRNRRATTVTAA